MAVVGGGRGRRFNTSSHQLRRTYTITERSLRICVTRPWGAASYGDVSPYGPLGSAGSRPTHCGASKWAECRRAAPSTPLPGSAMGSADPSTPIYGPPRRIWSRHPHRGGIRGLRPGQRQSVLGPVSVLARCATCLAMAFDTSMISRRRAQFRRRSIKALRRSAILGRPLMSAERMRTALIRRPTISQLRADFDFYAQKLNRINNT